MKTNTEIIHEAVKNVQGHLLVPGMVAGHPDDPVARELVSYEDNGKTAVLSHAGVTKRWPANEIFDPNEARDEAIRIKFDLPKDHQIMRIL